MSVICYLIKVQFKDVFVDDTQSPYASAYAHRWGKCGLFWGTRFAWSIIVTLLYWCGGHQARGVDLCQINCITFLTTPLPMLCNGRHEHVQWVFTMNMADERPSILGMVPSFCQFFLS